MAREFSVVVGINANKAVAGARVFKTSADKVNRSNRQMQTSTRNTNRRMTALITTMGRFRGVASVMFAGFLGVGGISSVIRTLSQFETAMASVAALVSAQNPRSLAANINVLTDRARELGATTLFTATQAAEGMKFLTLAGFDTLEVYQAIEPALNLAAAGMLGLGQAADIVSNIMAAFNVDASETESVVDALAFTAARTNTNIQQLGEAMKFVGPVAGTLGVNVQETAVALGILGNSGLQASLAGTSLRRVMSGLLNPSKEADKVLAKMGLTSEELVSILRGGGETGKGLVDLVNKLGESGLGAAEAFTLFGQRGAPGMLSLLTQADKLAEMTEGLDDIAGTAERMAKILADNVGGDARIALSSLQEAILQLGDAGLSDFLRESLQGFTGFIRGLTGIKTPMDEMTDAMKSGAAAAEFFEKNIKLIRAAAIALTIYLFRNTIRALATTAVQLGAAALKASLFGRSLIATRKGAIAAAAGLKTFRAALASTGVGIALIATGLLVDWLVNMGDAAEANDKFTDSLEDIKTKGEEVALVFQLMGQRQQENALFESSQSILETKDAIKDITDALMAQDVATLTLKDDREAYNRALERSQQIDSGPSGFSNMQDNIEATGQLLEARQQLNETEAAAALDRKQALLDLEILEESLADQIQLHEDLTAVNRGEAESVAQLRDERERLASTEEKIAETFEKTFGIRKDQEKLIKDLIASTLKEAEAVRKLKEDMELLNDAANGNVSALETLGIASADVARAQEILAFKLRKAEQAMDDLQKAALQMSEKNAIILAGTDKVKVATIEHTAALRSHILEMIALGYTAEEMIPIIDAMNEAHNRNIETLQDACKQNRKTRECTDESAKAMEAIWDQAWRNIQDTFSEAFRNIGDGFDGFVDGILDAFKDMIAEMAAQAAISNIFGNGNGFFTDFFGGITGGLGGSGGGGGSSGGSATGAVVDQAGGAVGDGIANAITGSAAFTSLAASAATFAAGAQTFLTTGVTAPQIFSVNATAGAGAYAAGGAAGAISGAVVDALLGSRGDPLRGAIFATVGGIIGSIWGAPGALIGGAIGAFVDNLIGGAQKLEKQTLTLVTTVDQLSAETERVVSTQRSFFRGRKFKTTTQDVSKEFQELEDIFVAFTDTLLEAAEQLGGSADGFLDDFEFARELNIKGKNETEVTRLVSDYMNDLILASIQEFVDDVTGLEPHIQATLETFASGIAEGVTTAYDAATAEAEAYVAASGSSWLSQAFAKIVNAQAAEGQLTAQLSGQTVDTIESFQRALAALVGISQLLDADLVTLTADAIEDANASVFESYQKALGAYREVITEYDGSLDSLERLAAATGVITELQAGLISVYQQIGAEISNLFQGSAQTVREALLSEEELYALRRSQIDDLVNQAANTTDPEVLGKLAEEINRLGLEAFNLLDAAQQQQLGQEFIDFFSELDTLFGAQIEEGIGQVVQDQADLDLEVATRLGEAADALLEAANTLSGGGSTTTTTGSTTGGRRRRREDGFSRELQR
jgi:TP901 family phage tail tape measure protein